MNILLCYPPTNESDDEAKDQFYTRLQTIIETLSDRDIKNAMGDFYAKVGRENTGFEEFMLRLS